MIINVFNVYVVPLLKYINHPALLQEWKINHDAAAYERNIDAICPVSKIGRAYHDALPI